MTPTEFIDMCKARNWDELISFLSSSIKDLSTKIVVTAIIGKYHPDKKIAQKYGLSCWDTNLSSDAVPAALSMIASAVDLLDFAHAYVTIKSGNALNDSILAESILTFVKENRMQLGQLMHSDKIQENVKANIIKIFGDLTPTKKEKEDYFAKYYTKLAKEKIAFLQAKDQVIKLFEQIFNFAPRDYHLSFNQASRMMGMFSDSNGGELSFKELISLELLKKYTEALKLMGLKVNLYSMPSYYSKHKAQGIQLFDSPVKLVIKLKAFQLFLNTNVQSASAAASVDLKTPELLQAANLVKELRHIDLHKATENQFKFQ